ncbi:interferon-inducible double-stranded RNA-dependent protein kinase activator A-like [Belonocnema kinseyi]|uniref:interferon-inducible double-stranded RNA-dependent protein kinase activator A-like n=1 Tax=Belonocnema kinseyi TaxID=2817044 RepID=UPI00143DE418|nr:interferon-inducible double-stranded RNA-dependent protein kinase activator A-like [Belonocnema kinseyi]
MSKSSISELQELMVKHKKASPIYDCIEDKIIGNNLHEFTIRVACDNVTACGIGSTKKVAKENAAKEMLTILKISSGSKETEVDSVAKNGEDFSVFPIVENGKTSKRRKSSISELQELVMKNRKSLPSYDCIEGKIVGNSPEFTIKVTCDDVTACGRGSSKKIAKENAAIEMLTLIKMNPCSKETATENVLQKLSAALFTDNEMKNSKTSKSPEKILKSAISELQELTTKTLQLLPTYNCVGAKMLGVNSPEFTMTVTCGNLTACGIGSSKKVAKENAAREILTTLKADRGSKETKAIENVAKVKAKKRPNYSPISELEELMENRKKTPPTYETVDDNDEKEKECTKKVTSENSTPSEIELNKNEVTNGLEEKVKSPQKLTEE